MRFLGWFRRDAGDRDLNRQLMALDGEPLWDDDEDDEGDGVPT